MDRISRRGAIGLGGGLAAAVVARDAAAQEAPALRGASAEERARLGPLIEGAKREGRLTYWDTVVQPETHDELTTAFRRHYGLPSGFRVSYTLSNTGPLVTRVEQETAAGRVTIDVAAIASPTWVFEKIASGQIMEYDSPEHRHYGKVFELGLGQPGYFVPNLAYVFVPMWNSETLDFGGKSWKDVLGAVPPGRLSVGNAGTSTSYLATHIGLRTVFGEDYFREVAKMRPVFLSRSENVASRVVSGQDMMAFSGMPTRAYQNNEQGAKLRFNFPEEGVVLMPQCCFIAKGTPNPNAAKLWIDFILSDQGQQILARREAIISGRAGFRSPLPDYAPPIDNLKLLQVDWKAMSSAEVQRWRDEWNRIFNP